MTAPRRVGTWRKSSYSNQETNCVEIAPTAPGGALLRDSKRRHGGHLTIHPTAWHALLTAAKSGHLDR